MRSKDGWRRSWGDKDQVINTANGDQWKLCNPNGTQCRMLQCAIQAEHSRTEVSTLTVYVHCNSKNLFLVFVCDVFHVPLMKVA